MLLKRAQYGQKHPPITGIISSIALEVDVDTPPAQLRTQIAEGEKFIGAQKHVDRPGAVGN
jgi:hypothetical protein